MSRSSTLPGSSVAGFRWPKCGSCARSTSASSIPKRNGSGSAASSSRSSKKKRKKSKGFASSSKGRCIPASSSRRRRNRRPATRSNRITNRRSDQDPLVHYPDRSGNNCREGCRFTIPRKKDLGNSLKRLYLEHDVTRPAVYRKGRIFKGERAEHRMADAFDGLSMDVANVVVTPHHPKLGTELGELIDERLHLRCSTSTRDIHTECTYDVARHAFPVILHGAGTRIEEDNAQHIALVRRQRAKVAQHNSGRPIPGKDVPGCRANERRAGVQSVEDALKAGRDSFLLMVAGLRRSPKAKQEEVLALDIRQHQGPRDPVEHIG